MLVPGYPPPTPLPPDSAADAVRQSSRADAENASAHLDAVDTDVCLKQCLAALMATAPYQVCTAETAALAQGLGSSARP